MKILFKYAILVVFILFIFKVECGAIDAQIINEYKTSYTEYLNAVVNYANLTRDYQILEMLCGQGVSSACAEKSAKKQQIDNSFNDTTGKLNAYKEKSRNLAKAASKEADPGGAVDGSVEQGLSEAGSINGVAGSIVGEDAKQNDAELERSQRLNRTMGIELEGTPFHLALLMGIAAIDVREIARAALQIPLGINKLPIIEDVRVNSGEDAHVGEDIKISARIQGTIQREILYDDGSSECVDGMWRVCPGKIVNREFPLYGNNPAKIKSAVLYYSIQDNKDGNFETRKYLFGGNVVSGKWMTFNKANGLWEVTIQKEQLLEYQIEKGDRIVFSIVAMDELGAIVTEDLFPEAESAPSVNTWYGEYALPATRWLCPFAGYVECFDRYSLNNDVRIKGNYSNPNYAALSDGLDIHGISIKADNKNIAIRIGLKGAPLMTENTPNMSSYDILFKIDKDSNPDDFQFENTYVLQYSPQMTGTDPMMQKVLLNGSCLTENGKKYDFEGWNSAGEGDDFWQCALRRVVGASEDLKIGYSAEEESIIAIIKKKGIGELNTGPYDLVPEGPDAPPVSIYVTSSVNDGNIYDSIGNINYYHRAHTIDMKEGVPPAPLMNFALCNFDLAHFSYDELRKNIGKNSVACKYSPMPVATDKDKCQIAWRSEGTNADRFNVYRGTQLDPNLAQPIADATGITDTNYFDPDLPRDGKTYYYFISSVSDECGETGVAKCGATTPPDRSKWTRAMCTTNYTKSGTEACQPCNGASCAP